MATRKRSLNEAVRARRPARATNRERLEKAPKPSETAILLYQSTMRTYSKRVAALVEEHVLQGRGGLSALSAPFDRLADRAARSARAAARRQEKSTRRQVARLFGVERVPYSYEDALSAAFVVENVRLLRRVGDHQIEMLRLVLADESTTAENLRERVEQALWISRQRPKLIARDQIQKLHYDFVQASASSLGSDGYVYVTRRDERVRESHRPHDNRVFTWTSPPNTGHPGTQVGCRCLAIPKME